MIILHLKKKIEPSNKFLGLFLFLFAIIAVRFNIINSIHNFINIESQNQYYYYIMFIVYSIILYFMYVFYKSFLKLRINISTILLLIVLVFYTHQLNTIAVGLINGIFSVLLNIKHLYLGILIFSILIFNLNLKRYKINYLLIMYIYIFFINIPYLTLFIFLVNINLLNRGFGKNVLIKLIHAVLLVLVIVTQQQLYIFYNDLVYVCINFLKVLKIDSIFTKVSFNLNSITDYSFFNKNSQIIFDLYKNNFDYLSGFSKSVFEKNVLISNNILLELYSYNFQKLIQIFGFDIFVFSILLLILIIFLKKIEYISIKI